MSENCAVCGAPLTDNGGWIGHARLGRSWCYGKHEASEVNAALGEDIDFHTLLWRFPAPKEADR